MRVKLATYLYRRYGEIAFFQAIILLLLSSRFKKDPYDSSNKQLFRCSCGELFWEDSPQDIQVRHCGHRFILATSGTPWEFLCLKMGWIR